MRQFAERVFWWLNRPVLSYRQWESARLFAKAMKLNPAPFKAYVQKEALQKAFSMTRTFLTREEISHCFVCLGRRALRRIHGRMACGEHHGEAMRAAVQEINGKEPANAR